ncbi:YSIRK-type signal peptide-containing protein [Lactobacillus mulieris]|nr:YSIRK-type signal peptide-containing protein [Lactobacillus mulieris]MCF1798010.1 YSIRK-type signal peptide-containing protein [Lactobacillus mulieris]
MAKRQRFAIKKLTVGTASCPCWLNLHY